MSDAEIRLMDMLAGWGDFFDTNLYDEHLYDHLSETDKETYEFESKIIRDFYQESANLNNGEPATKEQIESFIKEKIIPFILNGR